MPRQRVYGKSSRVVYDARALAFSSPEQPDAWKTTKQVKQSSDSQQSDQQHTEKPRRVKRAPLGDLAPNAVHEIRQTRDDAQPATGRRMRSMKNDATNNATARQPQAESTQTGITDSGLDIRRTSDSEQADGCECRKTSPRATPSRKTPQHNIATEATLRSSHGVCTTEYCAELLRLTALPISSFEDWITDVEEHFSTTKIAEASFGEVYRLSLLEDFLDISKSEESVFKIIALQPPRSTLPQDEEQHQAALNRIQVMSLPADVASEVKLLQRMTDIPGYTNFRELRILQGRPCGAFVNAFHDFDKAQQAQGKEPTHFPDPADQASYSPNQMWAVIEMQDAGTDLERLVDANLTKPIWTTWDIFWQVVLSLAKGEEEASFEHRDLHLGNICVHNVPIHDPSSTLTTAISSAADPSKPSNATHFSFNPSRKLHFTALETTIIDYTLSRARLADGTTAYLDLARDPALFEGDADDEYQYEIYRYMRGAAMHDAPYADVDGEEVDDKRAQRSWEQFHPQTSLIWLHFVLYRLLQAMEWPSEMEKKQRRRKGVKLGKEEKVARRRAGELEKVLLTVQDLLDPGAVIGNGMRNVGDLVRVAVEEGWLDIEDIIGKGNDEDSGLLEHLQALNLEG